MAIGSRGAAGWAWQSRYSVRRFRTTHRARTPGARNLSVAYHQNVAVLDDVFLAFQAQQTFLADTRVTGMVDQRLPVHDLGADELFLEVAMDRAGRLHSSAVHGNGPGAHLGFSGGQKGHQPQ